MVRQMAIFIKLTNLANLVLGLQLYLYTATTQNLCLVYLKHLKLSILLLYLFLQIKKTIIKFLVYKRKSTRYILVVSVVLQPLLFQTTAHLG